MLVQLRYRSRLRGWHLHVPSLAGIWLCLSLSIRAKTVDQGERGNAERRAMFGGRRPSTLYLIGIPLEQVEHRRLRSVFRR
jgi:hypothetical protein